MEKTDFKGLLKDKNRLLMLVVMLFLGILLIVVVVVKKKKTTETPVPATNQVLLEPDAKGEGKFADKLEAYKKEEQEAARKKRELEESQVKGSDFYFSMQDEEYESRLKERIARMQTDPLTNAKSEYVSGSNQELVQVNTEKAPITPAGSTRASSAPVRSSAGSSSLASRMRQQLDGIEDTETLDQIISEAQKNERLRNELEKNQELQNVIREKYAAAEKKRLEEENRQATPAQPVSVPAEDEKARRRQAMLAWNKSGEGTSGKTYQAVIHKTQTVQNGQMAMFRTREEIDTGSLLIPANTLIYGKVNFSQNRLNVDISSVTINRNVYPVRFSVYGTDGAPGIPVQLDKVGKEAESKVGDEVINTVRRNTGIIGSVIGSVANVVKNEKNISCTLIDNQTIYLKIN